MTTNNLQRWYSTKVAFYRIPDTVPYYMNLANAGVLERLQYRVKGKVIVYAIRCQVTNMLYVGSSFTPGRRLFMHLAAGSQSNDNLQNDINIYGLNKFTVYLLEEVQFPTGLSYEQRGKYLRNIEQSHMDKFPLRRLYNNVRSVAKTK